ncbi:DoxX family protein [Microbulbifer sp. OS29]|uniref:DoxX family protein n=1 Tax=Microbulbifer okhotskensis TaxID=2926617 RepID=A0A9X2EPZ4_9GAMM|nr:DoxX family protein [Microbulbifer okhotskensis]MCO1335679.1 DoxX family protein [Microbulbifer okhotskensis]
MSTSTLSTAQATPDNPLLPAVADLAGRIGLAAIFLLAGINKIQNYEGSAQYLAYGGLPENLLPLVIVFEIGGALALILGFQTRLVALALAGFSLITAALFHNNFADQMQFLMFFKNLAIAGGFLVVAAHGAGRFSVDQRNRNVH